MERLKALFKKSSTAEDPTVVRIRRRRAIIAKITSKLQLLRIALFVSGYVWLMIIPLPPLGRDTYTDENALLTGQASTYWDWSDVHRCDSYLAQLESLRDANSTSEQRAAFLSSEFSKLGISASTQAYRFDTHIDSLAGVNAYGVMSAPRTPGTEAIVISASWESLSGQPNLRGISVVLGLARYMKKYSLWAKDIVFVISDGHLDGMHAWLSAYHGTSQSNLQAEYLKLSSGVIWTALNIDYPGHSFSHLGVFFEGLNGRLPNQDLLNSFLRIARNANRIPVTVYDHVDQRDEPGRDNFDIIPTWVPAAIRGNDDIREYAFQAKNVARHIGYQARGRASGVHGLLHQFRIDAITVYAVPSTGPHGFHAIGRVLESTLRTANNLLERLHASFFFYILSGPGRFLQIGNYLPSVVLISVAMMFGGLKEWVDAAWVQITPEKSGTDLHLLWTRRERPVLQALSIIACTHIAGTVAFYFLDSRWFSQSSAILLFLTLGCLPLLALRVKRTDPSSTAPLHILIKSINLCFASTVVSVTTVLNFSLAAMMAVLLGVPLSISGPSSSTLGAILKYTTYTMLAMGWMVLGQEEMREAIWNWQILSVWFAPFICIVYAPLVMQAAIVCLL